MVLINTGGWWKAEGGQAGVLKPRSFLNLYHFVCMCLRRLMLMLLVCLCRLMLMLLVCLRRLMLMLLVCLRRLMLMLLVCLCRLMCYVDCLHGPLQASIYYMCISMFCKELE